MPSPADRLRILIVTHNYPRFAGDPAGAFVARIAGGVTARGHEVQVIAPHAPGTTVVEHTGGVRLHRFRYAPEAFERVAYTGGLHQGTLRSPLAALAFPGFLLAFHRALRRAVQRVRPHVIHAHWWFPSAWFARGTGIPYLITCHGSDVRLLERAPLRRMAAPVFRRAARVTTVSGFLAGDLKRLLPDVVRDVTVTPMPIDVAAFEEGAKQRKAAPPRILYAGNLAASKGVDVLIQAAAELRHLGVEFQLKILGEGPAERALRSLVARLGLGSRVTWSPFVPQVEMPQEYGASTITVLPSRGSAEGLGLTLVEALLAGSAIVGTPAGGIPEVIRHEQTGLLARDGDASDFARQIHRLLADAGLRDRLVRAGKEHVTSIYAAEPAVGRFIDLYYDIAAHRHHN